MKLPRELPDFTLPAIVRRVGSRLPQLPPTLALVAALNIALGRWLPREPLAPLVGKRFAIRVNDAGLVLRFALGEGGFRPRLDTAAADLTISARTRDFLTLLAREEDADALFFSRRLLMEGDTELGLLLKNTLDAVDWPSLRELAPTALLRRMAGTAPAGPAF